MRELSVPINTPYYVVQQFVVCLLEGHTFAGLAVRVVYSCPRYDDQVSQQATSCSALCTSSNKRQLSKWWRGKGWWYLRSFVRAWYMRDMRNMREKCNNRVYQVYALCKKLEPASASHMYDLDHAYLRCGGLIDLPELWQPRLVFCCHRENMEWVVRFMCAVCCRRSATSTAAASLAI